MQFNTIEEWNEYVLTGQQQQPPVKTNAKTPTGFKNDAEWTDYVLTGRRPNLPSQQVSTAQRDSETTPTNLKSRGEFTRGVLRGTDQLQGSLYGMAGLMGSLAGLEGLKDWGFEGYKRNMDEAALNPASVEFDDLSLTEPGKIATWAAGTMGELAPSMAEAVVTGAAGAVAGSAAAGAGAVPGAVMGFFGKRAARKLIEDAASSYIAKGMSKELAETLAQKEVSSVAKSAIEKQAMKVAGAQAGLVAGVLPMEAGGNWGEVLQERGIDNPISALATGAVSAFMELAGGNSRLIGKVLGPGKEKAFMKAIQAGDTKIVARIGKEAMISGAGEFAQEAGQEFSSMVNIAVNDPTFELFTKEGVKRMVEAGAAGFVGGFAGGHVSGYTGWKADADAETRKKAIGEFADQSGMTPYILAQHKEGAPVNDIYNTIAKSLDEHNAALPDEKKIAYTTGGIMDTIDSVLERERQANAPKKEDAKTRMLRAFGMKPKQGTGNAPMTDPTTLGKDIAQDETRTADAATKEETARQTAEMTAQTGNIADAGTGLNVPPDGVILPPDNQGLPSAIGQDQEHAPVALDDLINSDLSADQAAAEQATLATRQAEQQAAIAAATEAKLLQQTQGKLIIAGAETTPETFQGTVLGLAADLDKNRKKLEGLSPRDPLRKQTEQQVRDQANQLRDLQAQGALWEKSNPEQLADYVRRQEAVTQAQPGDLVVAAGQERPLTIKSVRPQGIFTEEFPQLALPQASLQVYPETPEEKLARLADKTREQERLRLTQDVAKREKDLAKRAAFAGTPAYNAEAQALEEARNKLSALASGSPPLDQATADQIKSAKTTVEPAVVVSGPGQPSSTATIVESTPTSQAAPGNAAATTGVPAGNEEITPQVKAFVENKVKSLGSVEVVNTFYSGGDLLSAYARRIAPQILTPTEIKTSETPVSQGTIMPAEQLETENTGKPPIAPEIPAATSLSQALAMLGVRPARKSGKVETTTGRPFEQTNIGALVLDNMRSELQSGAGKGLNEQDGEYTRIPSSYPSWFKAIVSRWNDPRTSPSGKKEGLGAKDGITVLDKVKKGETLTERQNLIWNDMKATAEENARQPHYQAAGREMDLGEQGFVPVSPEATSIIDLPELKRGDQVILANETEPFTILGRDPEGNTVFSRGAGANTETRTADEFTPMSEIPVAYLRQARRDQPLQEISSPAAAVPAVSQALAMLGVRPVKTKAQTTDTVVPAEIVPSSEVATPFVPKSIDAARTRIEQLGERKAELSDQIGIHPHLEKGPRGEEWRVLRDEMDRIGNLYKPEQWAELHRQDQAKALSDRQAVETKAGGLGLSFRELAAKSDEVQSQIDAKHDELDERDIPFEKQDSDPDLAALYDERIKYDTEAATKAYDGVKKIVVDELQGYPTDSEYASVDSILREHYSLVQKPAGVFMMSKYTGKALDNPKTVEGVAKDVTKLLFAKDYPNADFWMAMDSPLSGLSRTGKEEYIKRGIEKAETINSKIRDFFIEETTDTQKDNSALGDFFDRVFASKDNEKMEFSVGTSPANVELVENATGINIAGFNRVLDNYSLRHIMDKHGDPDIEAKRGQIAITREDFTRIPEITDTPDLVENAGKTHQGLDTIRYQKRINGEIFYLEEARTGKNQLMPVTMYKRKIGASDAPSGFPRESSSQASETFPDDVKITPAESAVKGEVETPASSIENIGIPIMGEILSGNKNTEDAGAELTANKRNRITTGIKWEDIADKNTALKVKETTKQNVYPRPDYQQMITDGMQPFVAHIVKQVYDALPAKPATSTATHATTDAGLQNYIEAINRVMNGTMTWARDNNAVGQWAQKQISGRPLSVIEMTTAAQGLLDTVYPGGWRNFQTEVHILGGNKVLRALQPGRDEGIKGMKSVKDGWPAKQEAWQKQGLAVVEKEGAAQVVKGHNYNTNEDVFFIRINDRTANRDTYYKTQEAAEVAITKMKPWFLLGKNGYVRDQFDTETEAVEAARVVVKRESKTGISDKGTAVEMAERTGEARRLEGEDITSDRLQEAFGFKGVNFGNWMKGEANQAERQLHLNHAYDSFMDLAEILDVPPQAMSLNGMLGLAIGAQGTGAYAAHFVPGVNEINLTRTSGAGSLAHEFGHALDHYFATQAGLAAAKEPFLTEHTHGISADGYKLTGSFQKVKALGDIRPEITGHFVTIVDAMNKRQITPEEIETRRQAATEKAEKNVAGWLKAIAVDFRAPRNADTAGEEFDRLAARIKALDLGEGKVSAGGTTHISPAVAELRDLYKQQNGRLYPLDNIKSLQANLDHLVYLNSDQAAEKDHIPQATGTDFAKNAAELDKGKGGKKYWSTNLEKFARAFDAYVSDTLAEKAAKNSYLSHAGRSGETVPQGTERTAINKAFDALVAEVKTRETETGIELFSRRLGSVRIETPLSVEDAGDVIRDFLDTGIKGGKLGGVVKLELADSFDMLPEQVRQAAEDAGGTEDNTYAVLHKDGSIWLVRDAHSTREQLEKSIFHEVYGHLGIFKLFGQDSITKLANLYHDLGGYLRMKKIAAKYGLQPEFESYWKDAKAEPTSSLRNARITAELLALIGQRSPTLMDRAKAVWGAIRHALRRLGFEKLTEYTDSDLAYLLAAGKKALHKSGKDGAFTTLMRAADEQGKDEKQPDQASPAETTGKIAYSLEDMPADTAENLKKFASDQAEVKTGKVAASSIGTQAEKIWKEKVIDPAMKKGSQGVDMLTGRWLKPEQQQKLKRGLQHWYEFWDPLSTIPDADKLKALRYKSMGDVARAMEFIEGLFGQIKVLEPDVKKSMFRYLDGQIALTELPEANRTLAAAIRQRTRTIGQAMVDRGILQEEQFKAHDGQYIHYLYARHIVGEDVGLGAIAIGNNGKMNLSETLSRNPNLTDAQRAELGLIEDASIAVPVGMGKALTDIAKFDYLNAVSENPDWVWQPGMVKLPLGKAKKDGKRRLVKMSIGKLVEEVQILEKMLKIQDNPEIRARYELCKKALATAEAETKNIPADFKQLPNSKHYGPLAGAFVKKAIADDIMPVMGQADANMGKAMKTFLEIETQAVAWFKLGKVAFNAPTIARNIISNFLQNNMRGRAMTHLLGPDGDYVRGTRSLRDKDKFYKEAQSMGLFSSNWYATEVNEVLNEFRKAGEGTFFEYVGKLKDLGKYYGLIDDWSKITIFRQMREEGASIAEAAIEAQKWGMDYSLASRSVKAARRHFIPFASYSYKIAPLIAESLIKRPWVIGKYLALFPIAKAFAMASLDMDDDDWDELEKQLPNYIKKAGSMLVLPWKSDKGQFQFVNLEYFMPWSNWFGIFRDIKEGDVGELIKDIGISHPILDPIQGLRSMKDGQPPVNAVFGQPVYNKLDAPAVKAAKLADWLIFGYAPTMLSYYHGALGYTVKAAVGGEDRWGKEATLLQAAGRWAGWNVTAVSPEQTAAIAGVKIQDLQRNLAREKADPRNTPEDIAAYEARFREEKAEIAREAPQAALPILKKKGEDPAYEGLLKMLETGTLHASPPSQSIEIAGIIQKMTLAQYRKYLDESSELARPRLQRLFESEGWAQMTDKRKGEVVGAIVSNARKGVRQRIKVEMMKERREKAMQAALPG